MRYVKAVLMLAVLATGLLGAGAAQAGKSRAGNTELVMFSTKSCIYCRVFNREVTPNYRYSKQARQAPLREVDIDRHGTGGYSLKRGVRVTPTFVLFRRGREVARIIGYPGKKSFYKMVSKMLKKTR